MLITLKKEKKNSKVNNSIIKDNLLFYLGQIVSKKISLVPYPDKCCTVW